MPFKTEEQLFEVAITSPFIQNMVDSLVYTTYAYIEPQGLFGIPDLLVANIKFDPKEAKIYRSFAFEMKLSNWRRALIQAYRYLSFVNYAFVVIDRSSQKPAVDHISEFALSNIGLISVDKSGFFSLHYYPKFNQPYSYDMECKLKRLLLRERDNNPKHRLEVRDWSQTISRYEKVI